MRINILLTTGFGFLINLMVSMMVVSPTLVLTSNTTLNVLKSMIHVVKDNRKKTRANN